jgi:hypothetical protein
VGRRDCIFLILGESLVCTYIDICLSSRTGSRQAAKLVPPVPGDRTKKERGARVCDSFSWLGLWLNIVGGGARALARATGIKMVQKYVIAANYRYIRRHVGKFVLGQCPDAVFEFVVFVCV